MSTGNEIVDLQNPKSLAEDGWGGVWDTNRPSLHAALEGLGYEVVDLGIAADRLVFIPKISCEIQLTTLPVSRLTSRPSRKAWLEPT